MAKRPPALTVLEQLHQSTAATLSGLPDPITEATPAVYRLRQQLEAVIDYRARKADALAAEAQADDEMQKLLAELDSFYPARLEQVNALISNEEEQASVRAQLAEWTV